MVMVDIQPEHLSEERRKIVIAARSFAPLLAEINLPAETIDEAIEELRPLRMHIHAIDYGDAPGFRELRNEIP